MEIRGWPGDGGHAHVTALMTRDAAGTETRRWSVVELVDAVRAGEQFGAGEASGSATVRPAVCSRCPMLTIVSDPPEALARLPACDDG